MRDGTIHQRQGVCDCDPAPGTPRDKGARPSGRSACDLATFPLTPARTPVPRFCSLKAALLCPGGNDGIHWQRRRQVSIRGFTLVELMVVIVLIGIMTAIILPEMKGTYEDALLRSTSRDLVSVCDLAASHAVSLNQSLVLRFDLNAGRYSIEPPSLGNRARASPALRDIPGGQGSWDTRVSIEVRKTNEDPTGEASEPGTGGPVRAGGRDEGIVFHPDGTADASEIMLRDRDGFRLALRINPITAQVRIIELARE